MKGKIWKEILRKPTIIKLIIIAKLLQLLKVDFIPQHGANAAKPLHELIPLARAIRHELQRRAEIFVVLREPFEEGALIY